MNKQEFLTFIEQNWTDDISLSTQNKLTELAISLFGNTELIQKIINFTDDPKYTETIEQILKNQTDESNEKFCLLVAGKVHQQMCAFDPLFPVVPMNGPIGLVASEYIDNGSISIKNNAIEAKKYDLHASFSIEAMEDMQNIHGIDIINELATVVANEIVREILYFMFAEISQISNNIICNHDNDFTRLMRIITGSIKEYKKSFDNPELSLFLPHHLAQEISTKVDVVSGDISKVDITAANVLDQFNASRNKQTGRVFNLVVDDITIFVYATDYLPIDKFIISQGSKLSAGCYYAPYKNIVGFNNTTNMKLSTRFGTHIRQTDKKYYTIFSLNQHDS